MMALGKTFDRYVMIAGVFSDLLKRILGNSLDRTETMIVMITIMIAR